MYYNVTYFKDNEWHVEKCYKFMFDYYNKETHEYISRELIHRVDFISEN
jgi:hypothetical protein